MAAVSVAKTADGQHRNEQASDIKKENINAVKQVCDVLRTSLGPRGMDKLIVSPDDSCLVTNDGATILQEMKIIHPAANMLVDLSHAQDVAAGDGTTTVVLMAGTMLGAAQRLLNRGIHSAKISRAFRLAAGLAVDVLNDMAQPFDPSCRQELLKAAVTSLSSKVVSTDSALIAGLAVSACQGIATELPGGKGFYTDLRKLKVAAIPSGSLEESELVHGLIFRNANITRNLAAPSSFTNAKVGIIQFCLSLPKTDMEQQVVVTNYEAMDKLLREERVLTAKLVKKIAATGCNVLLVQKQITRTAVSELAADYLAKAKIMLVRDVERDDIDIVSKALGAQPVSHIDNFDASCLGSADQVDDLKIKGSGHLTMLRVPVNKGVVSLVMRGPNKVMVKEYQRSINDAICVVKCLLQDPQLLPGGGAPEIEISLKLSEHARQLTGIDQLAVREYAQALELLPYTLAENCGMDSISIVADLKAAHAKGLRNYGIHLKQFCTGDMESEGVLQPLTVSKSAIQLATETVNAILKIDDVVMSR